MRLQTAIARIRKYKPTTPDEFRAAGVPLGGMLGCGAFREVLEVRDCPLVVKFPLNEGEPDDDTHKENFHEGIMHSALEMKKLKRLNSFVWIRRFLPKVYYYDRKHGIIVMRYYKLMTKHEFLFDTKFVYTLIKRSTGVSISDYTWGNVGKMGRNDTPVLIDCGY